MNEKLLGEEMNLTKITKLTKISQSRKGSFKDLYGDLSAHIFEGDLIISSEVTSLEGCPNEVVGKMTIERADIKSLIGAPQRVSKSFTCLGIGLESLMGCPSFVGEDFDCSNNLLKTLEGGPSHVGGVYVCEANKLNSLKGAPSTLPKAFRCSSNPLKSLLNGPKSVAGNFYCVNCSLSNLEGIPELIGEDSTLWCLQNNIPMEEIIKAMAINQEKCGAGFLCNSNYDNSELYFERDILEKLNWNIDNYFKIKSIRE